jgi:hypothetical protein
MRHRSIADALQRGLLAAEPPMPSGLEVAGRCLPAAGHVIGPLEAICDALIASLAGRCEYDVTVILARIPASRAG